MNTTPTVQTTPTVKSALTVTTAPTVQTVPTVKTFAIAPEVLAEMKKAREQMETTIQQARKNFETVQQNFIETHRKSLLQAMQGAQQAFDALRLSMKEATNAAVNAQEIWRTGELAKAVKALQLQAIAVNADAKDASDKLVDTIVKARSEVTADTVFNFIKESGKVTVGAVNTFFEAKASRVTIRNRLDELKAAGRIDEEKVGNKVFVFVKGA